MHINFNFANAQDFCTFQFSNLFLFFVFQFVIFTMLQFQIPLGLSIMYQRKFITLIIFKSFSRFLLAGHNWMGDEGRGRIRCSKLSYLNAKR